MLIIADSSALVSLSVCDALHLLDVLFGEVKVPQAVFDEVTIENKPAAERLRGYLADKISPIDLNSFVVAADGLGRGELEAMALYKHLHADYLLIDDMRARKVAQLNGIQITGSLGVLLAAKHAGIISLLSPYLQQLRDSDIHISERLIQQALLLAQEST